MGDNGAMRTFTRSLVQMSNVRQEIVPIPLAKDGMSIKLTHPGDKTCYAVDATGAICPIMNHKKGVLCNRS
jgi:hypothetical protein